MYSSMHLTEICHNNRKCFQLWNCFELKPFSCEKVVWPRSYYGWAFIAHLKLCIPKTFFVWKCIDHFKQQFVRSNLFAKQVCLATFCCNSMEAKVWQPLLNNGKRPSLATNLNLLPCLIHMFTAGLQGTSLECHIMQVFVTNYFLLEMHKKVLRC